MEILILIAFAIWFSIPDGKPDQSEQNYIARYGKTKELEAEIDKTLKP